MMMPRRALGRSDLDVPVFILGCGNFHGIGSTVELFGRGDDRDTSFAVLDRALELGITMFDTANSYGGGVSEQWLGEWVAERGVRDDVILSSKVGSRVGPGPAGHGLSRGHIREQIDTSLRRIGTDRLDLYLAHAPDESTPVEETVGAFAELVAEGKIRYYGVSNFSRDQLERTLSAADDLGVDHPVNLQHAFNLLAPENALETADVCVAGGVGFTAYSPLAGGLLTGKYRANQPPPPNSRMTLRPDGVASTTEATFEALARLETKAADHGVSLSALALAWAVADPAVTALVLGPRTPEQLTGMCAAIDISLTETDRAELSGIAATRPPDA
ncbi:MAG TPA: aldo/keto reductase [Pseudonocardiaceae bacterium]|nr:aldo/keto reductase [Pseudonocardiaceae bacterium]